MNTSNARVLQKILCSRASDFHRFQWGPRCPLDKFIRSHGIYPHLPVPARKRNVSFSSSFELGDRHLSHPPRLLLSSPLYSCFPRLAIPFRSGLLVLTPFQGHFVVVSGLRFFVDERQKEPGVAPFATLSVLTLHAECPRENFSPRDCCFPTMFLL